MPVVTLSGLRMIGSVKPIEYGVSFLLDGERRSESVLAETPYKAVHAAEMQNPGCRVEAVTVQLRVVGKCRQCGMTIFQREEKFRRTSAGLFCADCL